MKKILVALCGILVARPAVCTFYIVHKSMQDQWLYKLSTFSSTDLPTRGGYPVLATDIYQNGARFCSVRFDVESWGRAYSSKSLSGRGCMIFCKSGYTGTNCSDETPNDQPFVCNDVNIKQDAFITGNDMPRVEENIDLFAKKTPQNEGTPWLANDEDGNQSWVIPLAVLQIKEHAINVAPVAVFQKPSVRYILKGTPQWLCAQGYILNSAGNDCIRPARCDIPVNVCPGVNEAEFDEEKNHEWSIKADNKPKCRYFRCIGDNGFKSKTDYNCVPCGKDVKSGIDDDGVCVSCKKGQYFNSESKTCDGNMTPIPKIQMTQGTDESDKKCWKEQIPEKFRDCVLCDTGKTWQNGTCINKS